MGGGVSLPSPQDMFNSIADSLKGALLDPIIDTFNSSLSTLEDFFTKQFHNFVDPILGVVNIIENGIEKVIDDVENIINTIETLFRCTIAFFNFISALFIYSADFCKWIFLDLLPWIGQYIECTFQKIISIPKCIFWYLLDASIFTISIPFRFIFWLLRMEKIIKDYVLNPLEKLDAYIHDEGPKNLNTGIHIIHFPDSVTDKCYICRINPIRRKIPNTCRLTKAYLSFVNCRGGNSKLPKCKKMNSFFESKPPKKSPPTMSEESPVTIVDRKPIPPITITDIPKTDYEKLNVKT